MDERVIALTDLTKQYGRFTAVDRICLTIRKGRFSDYWGQTVPASQLPS